MRPESALQTVRMTQLYRRACSIQGALVAQGLTLFSSGMTAFTSLIFFSDTGGRSTS